MASAPPSWFLYSRCRGHLQARGHGSSTAAPPRPVSPPTRLAATSTTAPLPKGHCQRRVDAIINKRRRTAADLPRWYTSWGRHCSARGWGEDSGGGAHAPAWRAGRGRCGAAGAWGSPRRTPTGAAFGRGGVRPVDSDSDVMENTRPPVRLEKFVKLGDWWTGERRHLKVENVKKKRSLPVQAMKAISTSAAPARGWRPTRGSVARGGRRRQRWAPPPLPPPPTRRRVAPRCGVARAATACATSKGGWGWWPRRRLQGLAAVAAAAARTPRGRLPRGRHGVGRHYRGLGARWVRGR